MTKDLSIEVRVRSSSLRIPFLGINYAIIDVAGGRRATFMLHLSIIYRFYVCIVWRRKLLRFLKR